MRSRCGDERFDFRLQNGAPLRFRGSAGAAHQNGPLSLKSCASLVPRPANTAMPVRKKKTLGANSASGHERVRSRIAPASTHKHHQTCNKVFVDKVVAMHASITIPSCDHHAGHTGHGTADLALALQQQAFLDLLNHSQALARLCALNHSVLHKCRQCRARRSLLRAQQDLLPACHRHGWQVGAP